MGPSVRKFPCITHNGAFCSLKFCLYIFFLSKLFLIFLFFSSFFSFFFFFFFKFSRGGRRPTLAPPCGRPCRPLTPLHIGDRVLIQNQRGPHPTKWDKSGMIVDVKPYDQYLVKVDGSGRLTTRNRRFLRTFLPPSLTVSSNPQQRSIAPHFRQPCDTVPLTSPISPPSQTTPVSIPQDLTAKLAEPQIETPPNVEPTDADEVEEVDITPRTTTTPPPPMASAETPARPRRNRRPRKLYVPETGKWD